MAKIKVDGFTDEWECGTDPGALALDKGIKERMGDVSALESAAGKSARDAREALFMGALGVRPDGEKKKDSVTGAPNLFESLQQQIEEIEADLAKDKLVFSPLTEFKEKIREWSRTVSLREADDPGFVDELSEIKTRAVEIKNGFQKYRKERKQ